MVWVLLGFAIITLFFNQRSAFILLGITLIFALMTKTISLIGLVILLIIVLIACLHQKYQNDQRIKWLTEILLVLSSFALFVHFLPGFNNLKLLNNVITGPESAPFTLYFNFDKSLIPFVLMGVMPTLLQSPRGKSSTSFTLQTNAQTKMNLIKWGLLIAAMPLLLIVAMLLGGLRFEPHFPDWIGDFIFANFLFVSVAEEALFRGYLQQKLAQFIPPIFALIIASLFFGLMHWKGGILLIILGTLSGLIYGLAWMWSGRLWVSATIHFSFNLMHLLFFTYPFYQAAIPQ